MSKRKQKAGPRCYGCNKLLRLRTFENLSHGEKRAVSYWSGYGHDEKRRTLFCKQRCAVEYAETLVLAGRRICVNGVTMEGGDR